ncbi:Ribosomal protein, partial [Globisporangium splendens]
MQAVDMRAYGPEESPDISKDEGQEEGNQDERSDAIVWTFFAGDSNDVRTCRVCAAELTLGSGIASTSLRHVQIKHLELYNLAVASPHATLAELCDLQSEPYQLSAQQEVNGEDARRRGPTKSLALTFFGGDRAFRACRLCRAQLKHNKKTTSNYLRHIKSKHSSLYNLAMAHPDASLTDICSMDQDEAALVEEEDAAVTIDVAPAQACVPQEVHRNDVDLSTTSAVAEEETLGEQHHQHLNSMAWTFFSTTGDFRGCRLCGKRLKFNKQTTSNYLRHVRGKHLAFYNMVIAHPNATLPQLKRQVGEEGSGQEAESSQGRVLVIGNARGKLRGVDLVASNRSNATRLFRDYFAVDPTFGHQAFRRRFRMRQSVFLRIAKGVLDVDPVYFQSSETKNEAEGGLSTFQRVASSLRVLMHGDVCYASDVYVRVEDDAAAAHGHERFCAAVVSKFKTTYLHPISAVSMENVLLNVAARNKHRTNSRDDCCTLVQEACANDSKRAFDILRRRFRIVTKFPSHPQQQANNDIMAACIVLHNMIVEDERDDAKTLNDLDFLEEESHVERRIPKRRRMAAIGDRDGEDRVLR